MVPEAPLEETEHGLTAAGEGWYVVNAREAVWSNGGPFGEFTRLGEGDARFPELGINIGVIWPGQPFCMYHREPNQEGFLVLSGECILLVEGEERRLRPWDFFHCPADTDHVLVGAGDGPCAVLAVGSRGSREAVYPRSELALSHGAGVEQETASGDEAYAPFPAPEDIRYREDRLPESAR
jgi:uncharacterized cupin superfamily protein